MAWIKLTKLILFSVPDDHDYVVPRKMVVNMGDMASWTKSEAYHVKIVPSIF